MRDENYIPVEDDVDVELAALVAVGDDYLPVLQSKPKQVRAKLERALKNQAGADVIRMIRQEYREWVSIRGEMLTDKALDTLEKIMNDEWMEAKTASAAAKSSEMILDRFGFPKVSRRFVTQELQEAESLMPNLQEMLQKASSPQEAERIAKSVTDIVRQLDDLRRGAKETIDVRPGKPDESPG